MIFEDAAVEVGPSVSPIGTEPPAAHGKEQLQIPDRHLVNAGAELIGHKPGIFILVEGPEWLMFPILPREQER